MESVINKTLYKLASIIVEDALSKIAELINDNPYPTRHPKYPSVHFNKDNGMPNINLSSFGENRPISTFDFFRGEENLKLNQFNGYNDFMNYVKEDSNIKNYFLSNNPFIESFVTQNPENEYFYIDSFIKYLIEGSYHQFYKLEGWSQESFEKTYLPLEKPLFKKSLSVNVYVPILFCEFEFSEYKINNMASIVKMDEDFHKSRITEKSHPSTIPDVVLQSATHALKITGYKVESNDRFTVLSRLNEVGFYPIELINSFFNSIRIIDGQEIGYAQLLAQPTNWAERYVADLKPLHGISVKSYPPYFEKFYWKKNDLPKINEVKMEEITRLFNDIFSTQESKIKIAIRRLEQCLLRENEADSILDATIAMEALLSDGEKDALSYKLAVRMAVLLDLSEEVKLSKIKIYEVVRNIYKYRSSVVHGSGKTTGKTTKIDEGEPIETIVIAINFLRNAIRVMIDYPKYLKANKIDEELLLGNNQE